MALENEKELQQLKNRFRDLADKSFQQNIFTFTGFLGLSEQDIFWQMESQLRFAGCVLDGGVEGADRVMVRFGKPEELGYDVPFPIRCVHIRPVAVKFADKLSHRDFLGALMNLGIERSTIGDIKVGDKEAYLFCQETIAEYICANLEQIKHTHVKCELVEHMEEVPQEEPEHLTVQVSSARVDAVISKVYNKSRSDCLELFRTGKVFIDGRLCENNSRQLKVGETVNARGYGKFIFDGEPRETKKGKLCLDILLFG